MTLANQDLRLFLKSLMTHLKKCYFEDYSIGTIYSDEKNIVYFPFTPKELKEKKLKIAIVYNLRLLRFEIWLAAQNKQIQKEYWNIFKDSDWNKYHIPSSITDGYSIVDNIIIEKPDFNNFKLMIEEIETKSLEFIKNIVDVLKQK